MGKRKPAEGEGAAMEGGTKEGRVRLEKVAHEIDGFTRKSRELDAELRKDAPKPINDEDPLCGVLGRKDRKKLAELEKALKEGKAIRIV